MEQQPQSTSTEQVTTRSAGIRYGVIGGVISIIFFLLLTALDINMAEGGWRWLGFLISAIILFLAHKYYKDNGDGFMNYGQGIGIAFWQGLVASLISSVFTFIYVKFIDPGFLDTMRQVQEDAMAERGMSDEQIEQAMKFASMFTTPAMMFIMGLIMGIIGAIIIGLIVSIFTQKKRPETAF